MAAEFEELFRIGRDRGTAGVRVLLRWLWRGGEEGDENGVRG